MEFNEDLVEYWMKVTAKVLDTVGKPEPLRIFFKFDLVLKDAACWPRRGRKLDALERSYTKKIEMRWWMKGNFSSCLIKKKQKKETQSQISVPCIFLHSLAKKFKSSLKYSHWLQRRSLHSWRMILLINWFQEYYTRGLVDEHHKDRLWCSTEEKKKEVFRKVFFVFFPSFPKFYNLLAHLCRPR